MIGSVRVTGNQIRKGRKLLPMPILDLAAFQNVYSRSIEDVLRFVTPARQEMIAIHNRDLGPDSYNPELYMRASERRYTEVVRLLNAHARYDPNDLRALEVGGFLGAYPLTLARLGTPVTLVEHYDYYYGAFDDLADYLRSAGVTIWDVDFTKTLPEPPVRYTLVTNMAMLEHLADSPKALMDNLALATDDDGLLVVEVPNIAYYPKRRQALMGRSIHPDLATAYWSTPPYMGHHREYTRHELTELLSWTGLEVEEVKLFNYSVTLRRGTLYERLRALTVDLWPTYLFPDCREVITAIARPSARAERRLAGNGQDSEDRQSTMTLVDDDAR